MFPISSQNSMEIKLGEMLKENVKLKKTIEENDNAMKQQFEKISLWQNQVMSVCDAHKQNYNETRDLINRLREENEYLRVNNFQFQILSKLIINI